MKLPPGAKSPRDEMFTWRRTDLYDNYRAEFAHAGGDEWWIPPRDVPRWNRQLQGHIQIVGKGPSLDTLTHLENVPTFCVNQSVRAVEKLSIDSDNIIMIQQDKLFDVCEPSRGWHLASIQSVYSIKKRSRLLYYAPGDYGCNVATLTAIMAMHIVKVSGASSVKLLCFDGGQGYAKSIDCPNIGSKDRFVVHGVQIRKALADLFPTVG